MMIYIPNNPSDEVRHEQLKLALSKLNRIEDFQNIIQYTSPPPPITSILPKGSLKNKKIGVIGAGCAGLASSYELRKLGSDITIFESNPNRIGGRIYTYFFDEGLYGELGAMRIPSSHETSWHYINEFQLNTNPFIQSNENDILYVKNLRFKGLDIDNKVSLYLYPKFNLTKTESNIPLSTYMDYIYNQPILNMPRDIRPFIISIRKNYPYQINHYDQFSFRKVCEDLGLSRNVIDMINSVLGIDSGVFYNNYLEIMKESYPINFDNLYEITGGFYKLPYAFYESFKIKDDSLGKVDLKLGKRVTGIYEEKNQVIIKYINTFDQTFHYEYFDYIMCTIPFSTLRLVDINPLFSNNKMAAIKEVNYSPAQKTFILFKERFWENLGGRIITDQPIISSWFPSHAFRDNSGVLLASYNLNLDATRLTNVNNNYSIYETLRQLEASFGFPRGYLNEKMVDYKIFNWNQYEHALGAFTVYYTEQNALFSYPSFIPEYENKVFFAGEHVSPFHAWLQGSFQSAMMAANLLAETVKCKF